MGFFSPNFAKAGKGVSKEKAMKRDYFDILGLRFWDLIKINLLYVLCNIPAVILCVLLGSIFWTKENIVFYLEHILVGNNLVVFSMVIPLFPLCLTGPFTAGLTYIVRNFVKREPVFLFSDFFEHSKKNIKQSLIINVILFVIFSVFASASAYYLISSNSIFARAMLIFVAIMLCSLAFYVYPLMVSFELKIKDIIKNSWIFALSKLFQNLFFLIILVALHLSGTGLYGGHAALIWTVLMVVFLIAWSAYTVNYYAWHVIEMYMFKDENEEDNNEENKSDEINEEDKNENN
ncbi:MAG: YesL family protein [Clostridia bacterium]|nr:YesL family protein [Clostridia bacterium]